MELPARLASVLDTFAAGRRVLVAIDGPDAAGKTTLAEAVADRMTRPVVRVCVDDWHLPKAVRLRRGPDSPEGCYRDSFDVPRLLAACVHPFRRGAASVQTRGYDHRADMGVSEHQEVADVAVLLVDGVFLLRPELRDLWDLAVYLHVSEEVTLTRAGARGEELLRYRRRYLPAQVLYREEADPLATADVIVDNSAVVQPAVIRWGIPELAMLWEGLDAPAALAARFGFDNPVAAGRWVARSVAEQWGLQVDACERIVMSAGNALAWVSTPAGPHLLKWSVALARFPHLAWASRLVDWLHDQGLPVSRPLPSMTGALQREVGSVSMGLQRVVPGDHLDVGSPEQVRAAGALLARLHAALRAYPDPGELPQPMPLAQLLTLVPPQAPADARDVLDRLVRAAPKVALPVQLVHGDFRAANLLRSPSLTVIDFEEARLDHAIVELARSAVMLGTLFKDWGPVSPEVHLTFLAGYESVVPLTAVEAGWWDVLVLWFSLALIPPADDPTGWRQAALRLVESGAEPTAAR